MTDQPSTYAAEVECAIGLHVGGGADGVYAARDAVLAVRDREMEQLRADLARVQQAACRTAEALRLTSQRLDAVLADRENERAARTAEEKRARTAEARVAELEKLLADELTALDQPQQPTEDEVRQLPCSLWLLSNGHAPHWWQPQPGMADVLCPGAPRKAVATQPQQPTA